MKQTYLVVIVSIFLCMKISSEELVYGGQYYPGEFLLQGYDFFEEAGIDVEHILFSSGTENTAALISGNADVNVGSDSKTAALFNSMGEKMVIIGVIQRGNRYSTIVRDSTVEDWAQLKGAVVGTRFGTGAEFVLRKYFDSRSDLSWDDFKWVNLNTEDMISTLASGRIEAFTVWAPTGEISLAQDVGLHLQSYGDVALTPVQIHTTRAYADNNREKLVRFLMAHLKKAELIEDDPEKAAKYAAQASRDMGISVSSDAYQLMFERIDFSLDFDETLVEELTTTAEFLHEQGKLESVPEFYIDRSFLQEAQERIRNER
ncbi:MAG: ABC transporter substrate-binding protein [Fibrobacterota bacterium]